MCDGIAYFIIFIIIFILLLPNKSTYENIPKIIWTFWEGDTTDLVKKCMNTWKKYNPDYKIIILNRENMKEYIQDVDVFNLRFSDSPARISDFARLNVLSKFGGVWVDATCIITESFEWFPNYEYIGYYTRIDKNSEEFKNIESWFFACIPGSSFVSKWRDEFMRINEYDSIDDYIRNVETDGVDLRNIGDKTYLTIYVSCQRVLQKMMTGHEISDRIFLLDANEQQKHWWGRYKEVLCGDRKLDVPVIKFTKGEREMLGSDYDCIFRHY